MIKWLWCTTAYNISKVEKKLKPSITKITLFYLKLIIKVFVCFLTLEDNYIYDQNIKQKLSIKYVLQAKGQELAKKELKNHL